ncbi:hypothetical protein PCANB_001963 [Pneumocystis canis]|nr:hypothetical protein PCANB_001963 [Pneumocystis canis]
MKKRIDNGRIRTYARKPLMRRSKRFKQPREMFNGLYSGNEVLERLKINDESSNESSDTEIQIEDEYIELPKKQMNTMKRIRQSTNIKSHKEFKSTLNCKEISSKTKLFKNIILETLLDHEASLDILVLDWIDGYEREPQQALLELINGIIWSCGSDQIITLDHLKDQDTVADTLYEIQEASRENLMRDYPIISKTNLYKGFKKQLINFFHCFITHIASKEYLYNNPELIEQLQTWVIAMSSSPFRSFRHTNTIISFVIVSSLCDVMNRLIKEENVANKQYEAEKKRKNSNDERIAVIKAKISTLGQQIGLIKTMIDDFFNSVFVHRYRDIDPKIRCDCVHALGLWMIKLPSVFFDGAYLRYMGWVLSDISPLTRLEVVKALTKLYFNNEFIVGLRHFTERFKPRLIEMALYEADPNIRSSSINLLDGVRLGGFLESDEIDLICTLLFDVDSKIRKKACPFFLSKVEESFENKIQEIPDLTLKQINGSQNTDIMQNKASWIKYKVISELLVQLDETADDINSSNKENVVIKNHNNTEYLDIVSESKPQSRIYLASMALFCEVDELKNWEPLTEYLLYDHMAVSSEGNSPKKPKYKFYQICAPTEKEEIMLLEILYTCVYMDITSLNYDIKYKKKLSTYVKEEHEESISRALLELVPALLKKYNSSPSASASILRLEQLMKLNVYQQFRQNKTYENLLDLIGKQFMKHPNNLIMKEAASSLLKAQQYDELASITREKITEIQEEVVNELKSIRLNKNFKTTHLSNKIIENLAISVKRLDYISSISDCTQVFETESFSVFSVLLEIIERDVPFHGNQLDITINSLKTLKWLYIWRVKHLMDYKNEVPIKELNVVISDRDKLFNRLYFILENKKYYEIAYHVVSLLIDLYTVFSNFKTINTTQIFDETIFIIPENAQNIIISTLSYYIKQYAKYNKCKDIKFFVDDEDSDQELDDEDDKKMSLISEKYMCEITGKIVLAILSGAMDRKYISYLIENKDKLGLSYNHIIMELNILKRNESVIEQY